MICNFNCSECELAAKGSKRIVVDVIGHEPEGGTLSFSGRHHLTVEFGEYLICFVNHCGEDVHIGRKIISTKPSVVLDIIDSMSLQNSLRLTSRLIDMDYRAVLAFSAYDRLLATGHSLDYEKLGEMMGFASTVLDASEESFSRLLSLIVETYRQPVKKHVHVPYGQDVDKAIEKITALISRSPVLSSRYHDRYLAVRLLEDPEYISPLLEGYPIASRIAEAARAESQALTRQLEESPETLIRKARHGYIHGALVETLHHSSDNSDHTLLQKIDAVLTNRVIGLPLLLVVLFLVFEATFVLGALPQQWIEDGVELLCAWLTSVLPSGWLTSLLVDGVVQGCGAVISFLPNIFILFVFLSLLEDTGYMARAAFLMDKIMHRIGLHGRSFVPMLPIDLPCRDGPG